METPNKRASRRRYEIKHREEINRKRKERRANNPDKYRAKEAIVREKIRDTLNRRRREYVSKYPERARASRKKYYDANRETMVMQSAAYNMKKFSTPENRMRYLAMLAKARAKKSGRDCEMGFADQFISAPPERCKCCNITLDYSRGNGKNKGRYPSIDRVRNNEGYIKGNVAIICRDCNTAKRNYSIHWLRQVLLYMERFEALSAPKRQLELLVDNDGNSNCE